MRKCLFLLLVLIISCNFSVSFDDIKKTVEEGDLEKIDKLLERSKFKMTSMEEQELLDIALKLDNSNYDYTNLLLDYDLNPNSIKKATIERLVKEERWDYLKILIDHGLDVNFQITEKNIPLIVWFLVYHNEQKELILSMIETSEDLNVKYKGFPVFFFAIRNCSFDIIDAFLNSDIDLNLKNEDGRSSYNYAISQEKFEIALKIYKSGIDFESIKYKEADPWHELVNNYSDENSKLFFQIADIYLKNGLTLNYSEFSGLHAAVIKGNTVLVKWFLENGADPIKIDEEGKIPADYLFFILSSPTGVTSQEDYDKADEILNLLGKYGSRDPDFVEFF